MVKLFYFTWVLLFAQIYQVRCLSVEGLNCRDGELSVVTAANLTTLSGLCDGFSAAINNDRSKIVPKIRNSSSTVTLRLDWSNSSPRITRDNVEDTRSFFATGVQLISSLNVTSKVLSLSDCYNCATGITLGNLSSGLTVSHGCGVLYLRAALYITSSLSDLQQWISYKSYPVFVPCIEAGFDLRLNVTWGATNKNASNQVTPTIIPGKTTLRDAIPNLSIFLQHIRGDSVLPRTPLAPLELWVYIRNMPHDTLTLGAMPAEVSKLRLGDVILNDGRFNHPGVSAENSYEIRNLYSLTLPKPSICGEAVIIINLDPMQELPEYDRSNNIATIPVYVDCWGEPDLMGKRIGMCTAVSEEVNNGKRAWFYTQGIPYGSGQPKAYEYQADDKTFKKLTVTDNSEANSALQDFVRLRTDASVIDCPTNPSEAESITSTVDSLSQLLSDIRSRLIDTFFAEPEKYPDQDGILMILQSASGILTAGGVQGQGIMQQFMDGMLGSLFNNRLLYPGDFSESGPEVNYTVRRNGSRGDAEWAPYPVDSYHSMLARTLSTLMSAPEWPLPFANSQLGRALPKFFNQLLWSPENLWKSTPQYTGLSQDVVADMRAILVMVLKEQLPRTFDPLGSLIPILNLTLPDFVNGMPIETWQVRSTIDSLYTAVETVRTYLVSITTMSPTRTPNATMTPSRPPNTTVRMFNSSTPFTATTVPPTTINGTTTTTNRPTFNGTSPTTLPPFTAPSFATTTRVSNVTTPVNGTTPFLNMTTRNPNVTQSPMGNNTVLPRLSADLISRLGTVMNLREPGLLDRFTTLSAFLNTIRDYDTVLQLTKLVTKVQGSMALRNQWMLSEGMFAPVPRDVLCRRQAAVDRLRRLLGPTFVPDLPIYWDTDETTSSIFRGDLSTMTGRVYWTKVAVCSCESGNSGSYMAYDPMNPGQSSGDMGAKPPK